MPGNQCKENAFKRLGCRDYESLKRMRALFVARHNNDYDSIVPIVDHWARTGNEALIYFPTPQIRWKDDFRTAILRQYSNVRFADLWDMGAHSGLAQWLSQQWKTVTPETRAKRKFLQIVTENALARRYEMGIAAMLDDFRPQVICFDWYSVPAKRPRFGFYGYQPIMRWAVARAIPTVALPHGLVLFDPPKGETTNMAMYSMMFVESEQRRKTLLSSGGELCEIAVTGSARYDPTWVEKIAAKLDQLHPAMQRARHKINIVFFGTKQVYEFDFAEQNRWLIHLSQHPEVELVIQPHPRGQKMSAFAALAGRPNVTIDPKTPATVLISRADMVSTLTSSVMVEAILRGREILYPKFCNTVVTRFEEKGACITLEKLEDSHPAIDNYLAGKRVPRENYEAFLEETAWGGKGPDTIKRICDRLAAMAQGQAG